MVLAIEFLSNDDTIGPFVTTKYSKTTRTTAVCPTQCDYTNCYKIITHKFRQKQKKNRHTRVHAQRDNNIYTLRSNVARYTVQTANKHAPRYDRYRNYDLATGAGLNADFLFCFSERERYVYNRRVFS